jgi:hypothetical protein
VHAPFIRQPSRTMARSLASPGEPIAFSRNCRVAGVVNVPAFSGTTPPEEEHLRRDIIRIELAVCHLR